MRPMWTGIGRGCDRGQMPSLADAVAQALSEAGIRLVFGLPGGETVELLDSIRRSKLDFTLVHHETAAAFMASATARLSGRPSACLATLGPGATNLVTGVAHAHLDRAPVLVITAQISEQLAARHTHQRLDLQALFRPVTKASLRLESGQAHDTLRQALHLTTTGRPGPVHLQIGNEAAAREAVAVDGPMRESKLAQPSEAEIEKARRVVSESERPVLVAGLALEPERPYASLIRLAETIHAPVIVTPKAKGAIPDDHPLFAGTIGLTKTDPVYAILDQADCVLAVGLDVVELVKPWEHPGALIWVAPWANQDPVLPAAVELVGPMGSTLDWLMEQVADLEGGWGEPAVQAHRQQQPGLQGPDAGEGLMAPQAVLRVLRERLPREALLTTDVGSHKILACLEWPAYTPNRLLVSNGLSSMGYALPAANAAALHLPDTPVVCTVGDAGLAMSLGELGTLARLEAAVLVVVFKDHALDLIRSHQTRAGKPPFGTEFASPDFVGIASAHGILAERAMSVSQFSEAAERWMTQRRPMLIEVAIDPTTYPTTPAPA